MKDPSHIGAARSGGGHLFLFVLGELALPVLVLVAYFALPIYGDSRGPDVPYRVGLFVVGILGVGGLFLWQVSLSGADAPLSAQLRWLFAAVLLTVAFFAIVYLILARSGDAEIVGVKTKIDSLYFTVTVLTTVGFGDIRATGQSARVVVTIQMVFDVLFVASAASALRSSLVRRRSMP